MKNIAILTPNYLNNFGISQIVRKQAEVLLQDGNEVTIYTFISNMAPPEGVHLEILGKPNNFILEKLFYWTFPINMIKTRRYIYKLKHCDVIISHFYPMNWLAFMAKILYGKKYIYYNHGLFRPLSTLNLNLIERIYLKINFVLEESTASKATRVISISQYCQQQFKNITGINSNIIYDTIDMKKFNEEIDKTRIKKSSGLTDSQIILFVGTIGASKGIHILINAFNEVKYEIPNVTLILIGKHLYPKYSEYLKEIANESVIFKEDISDEELPYYYAACDLYASASIWEGFNLPLIEAQACGRPVIAFNIGPHTEVVINNVTGILVQPCGDHHALAIAIKKLLNDSDLRLRMSNNARKMVQEKFSYERFKSETCNLIRL